MLRRGNVDGVATHTAVRDATVRGRSAHPPNTGAETDLKNYLGLLWSLRFWLEVEGSSPSRPSRMTLHRDYKLVMASQYSPRLWLRPEHDQDGLGASLSSHNAPHKAPLDPEMVDPGLQHTVRSGRAWSIRSRPHAAGTRQSHQPSYCTVYFGNFPRCSALLHATWRETCELLL